MGQEASKLVDIVRRRIRELRIARGLTQAQVCESAGISVDAVTRIESGSRAPELRTIELLALALGVAPREFFEGTSPPQPPTASVGVRRMIALLESQSDDMLILAEGVLSGLVRASRRCAHPTTPRAHVEAEAPKRSRRKKRARGRA